METRKHENFEKYLDIFTMIVDHPMLNNGDALPKPLPNQRMDINLKLSNIYAENTMRLKLIFSPSKQNPILFYLTGEKGHLSHYELRIISCTKVGGPPQSYKLQARDSKMNISFRHYYQHSCWGENSREKLGKFLGVGEEYYLQPKDQERYERDLKQCSVTIPIHQLYHMIMGNEKLK